MPDVPPADPPDFFDTTTETLYDYFNDVSDFLYGSEPEEYIATPDWDGDQGDWTPDWVGDEGDW